MSQISSYRPSRRRATIPQYLIYVLGCSMLGMCTSEALVPSSNAFLTRDGLRSRGGADAMTVRSSTLKSELNDINGDSPKINGASASANNKKAIKIKTLNGQSQLKKNNINNNGKKVPIKNSQIDYAVPADFIAETNLPTDLGQYRLRAYRTEKPTNEFSGNEPCVIYAADKPPFGTTGELKEDVPVRIHDQCLTSEVFRSQRCDCKQQLKMALEYIGRNGGAIVYMQQEGRGIGLANKIAAYSLQDVGMDTVDANLHLGFPEDARQYGSVPAILEDMKIGSIKLLTNNPRKVQRLRALGVNIKGTEPMVVPATNPYNHRYMESKHDRMNHTNLSPLFVKNGNMMPKRTSLAENYITEGEEMATNAIQVSLEADELAESELGVTAAEDGYCFGRQSVEDAIIAIKDGKMVVVVDDMNRENEGDLIMAAEACTPQDMATIVRYSSGVVCVGMEGDRMDELKLPAMVANNEDPKGTAFSVTVDATKQHGITTGISAKDRAKTVRMLADAKSIPTDFARPGHIFPLRAREGGVLTRDGHTEAAVDISILAGRGRVGLLCEIVSEENPTEMARLPELKRFCKKHGFVLTSIVDIAQYRRETEATSSAAATDFE
eukprot:scaffold444_cov109-Cylindrotheca_fusiformis.AAC.16